MASTQLYNKRKEKIYPATEAKYVNCDASGKTSTVHSDIAELYKQIADLTGDDEAANNIIITISYKRSQSSNKADIIEDSGWSTVFISPSSDYPYIWKRTIITYKGAEAGNTTYEIVASANAEITQTIYRAVSDNSQPVISYEENGKDNPSKYDTSLPEFWSLEPVSVSASAPNVFMSVRTKKNGKWGKFSIPAQYGRWAYDSNVVFRYKVTGDTIVPEVNKNLENPGEGWEASNTEVFKGCLWVITATEVNGQLQSYNDVIWNGPNLMSIVK